MGTPTQDTYAESTEKSISLFEFNEEILRETRYYLDELPKMYRYEIDSSEFQDFDINSIIGEIRNIDKIVLIVKGNKDSLDVLLKSNKAKEYEDMGIRLKTYLTDDEIIYEDKGITSFEEEVRLTIDDDLNDILKLLKKGVEAEDFLV